MGKCNACREAKRQVKEQEKKVSIMFDFLTDITALLAKVKVFMIYLTSLSLLFLIWFSVGVAFKSIFTIAAGSGLTVLFEYIFLRHISTNLENEIDKLEELEEVKRFQKRLHKSDDFSVIENSLKEMLGRNDTKGRDVNIKLIKIDITNLVKIMQDQGVDKKEAESFITNVLSKTNLLIDDIDVLMREFGVIPVYELEKYIIKTTTDNNNSKNEAIDKIKRTLVLQECDNNRLECVYDVFVDDGVEKNTAKEIYEKLDTNSAIGLDELENLIAMMYCKDIYKNLDLIIELSLSGVTMAAITRCLHDRKKIKVKDERVLNPDNDKKTD